VDAIFDQTAKTGELEQCSLDSSECVKAVRCVRFDLCIYLLSENCWLDGGSLQPNVSLYVDNAGDVHGGPKSQPWFLNRWY